MQQKFIIHQQRRTLLLFFAGWGMDETPFTHYTPTESDFMICYDYHTLHFDESAINGYEEIHLVAWSMGVWAASQVMQNSRLHITRSIAINGTPYPVDDTRGIPSILFQGTLEGLNEASLLKFYRRMCLNKQHLQRFQSIAPHRSIKELQEELAAISLRQQGHQANTSFVWQQAIIGDNDRIFPPAHQQQAWKEQNVCTQTRNEAHYDEALFSTLFKNA